MLDVILAVLLSGLVAIFALENTGKVTLYFSKLVVKNVPIYAVVLATLLLGLLIGWIINGIKMFLINRKIQHKEYDLRAHKTTLAELTKRVHQLEIENEHLRAAAMENLEDEKTL